jgi:5-(carboxyamino)imidazole ribonucleotide synthase
MTNRLGIIGAGQLGLYLCEAAQSLGIEVAVISDTPDAAALQRANKAIVAELDNFSAIDQFLACCDVVTFDKEDVPNNTLFYLLECEQAGKVRIHPGADTLLMIKDKGLQKTWLQQQNLPTLPFHLLSEGPSSVDFLVKKFGRALVQKARCGGYDGRGVQVLESLESAAQLWNVPSIVEPCLKDCREISVIAARDQTGFLQCYPPVSMEFDAQLNSVSVVAMPANISLELADRAVELAERVVTLLDGAGVFAIEMFVTPAGELLINEISPRVHNSGHVTLDACNVSQFEQHVRAVTGRPLVPIVHEASAVMLNILYTEKIRDNCPDKPIVRKADQPYTSTYWYGKAPGTKGRKMGHINAAAPSIASAVAAAHHAMSRLGSGSDSEQAA